MARKKSGGEGGGNAALVIFLVLFILLSIGLGVAYWTGRETVAAAEQEKQKAATDIKAAQAAQQNAEEQLRLYKAFVGTATPEEKASLQSPLSPETLRAEHQKLMEAANNAIKTTVSDVAKSEDGVKLEQLGLKFNLLPQELFTWNWPNGGALPAQPAPGTLIDRLARVVAERERTYRESLVQRSNAADQAAEYKKAKEDYVAALTALNNKVDAQIKALETAIAQVETEKKQAIETFESNSADFRKSVGEKARELEQKQAVLNDTQSTLSNVRTQLQTMLDRQNELDMDRRGAFAVNVPHGKVLNRSKDGKLIEIDIGSADGLRPGQTFTVQPASARIEGLARRKKQTYDGQGRLVISDELVSKGAVEVVEVLGPNLATARITEETDDIRDSILKGDLLYNPLFRKNARDHVVLVGIFDVDADGIDDVTTVARNLAKRGAIVDGYLDMSTGKWESLDPANRKPGPGATTTYVVRGWDFDSSTVDPLNADKGNLRSMINNALNDAKSKGAQEVKAAKFLSEIGYSFSPAISDETVNAAAVKYLGGILPPK